LSISDISSTPEVGKGPSSASEFVVELTMRYSKLSGLKAQKGYYQALEKITGIGERDQTADVPLIRN